MNHRQSSTTRSKQATCAEINALRYPISFQSLTSKLCSALLVIHNSLLICNANAHMRLLVSYVAIHTLSLSRSSDLEKTIAFPHLNKFDFDSLATRITSMLCCLNQKRVYLYWLLAGNEIICFESPLVEVPL
jgi:hypothetical protein